jgi:aspartate-semialdehyde dehydrogenase
VRRRRLADAGHHGGTVSAASRAPRVAVVGASSLIGEALVERLREQKFQTSALHLLDDARELGRPAVRVDGEDGEPREVQIGDIASFDFSSVELAFFCARTAVAASYAEAAAAHAWVIDGSSAFRGRADVPLVVADVNGGELASRAADSRGLIALPGSASAALSTVLAPLHALAGLKRVDVATYQAVSGSGRAAMEALAAETVDLLGGRTTKRHSFGKQIAFNVIPQVDALEADGASLEERRLATETRRVLGLPGLALNATAVRVPVFFGHSFAVHASFERDCDVPSASAVLRRSNGVALIEADSPTGFPTPATEALAPDRVYVGRLRVDSTRDRSLNFWVVADNVRKCAAYNAFSTAQILVNRAQ